MSKMNKINLRKRLEEVRQNSESIDELIQNIKETLLEFNVKIYFKKYPITFSDSVSNTHSAPAGYKENWSKEPNLPTGYPGWIGMWEGTIDLDNKNLIRKFSDLRDIMPCLKTGTGCPGTEFSIGGSLFLYDFPKIYEQYEGSKRLGNIKRTNSILALKNYHSHFVNERDKYVINDPIIKEIDDKINNVYSMLKKLNDIKEIKRQELKNQFNREKSTKLKLPKISFGDGAKEVMSMCCDLSDNYCKEVADNKFKEYANYYNKTIDELNDYISKYPEIYI